MKHTLKQDKKNLISIIIATYNAGDALPGCLDSIISQNFKNIEIIIMDGGSKDNTINYLQSNNWPNLTWISEPDAGIYDALNKGILLAKGDWFCFLGSDDRLLPGFSELALKLTQKNTVYYGYTKEYHRPGNKPSFTILTGEFSKYRLAKYCLNHQAILYPSSVFISNKYDLKYKVFADYALNLKIWGDKAFKKEYHPIAIVSYNMSGFSSKIEDKAFEKDKPGIIKNSMGWLIYLRFLLKRTKKRLLGETDLG